MPRLAGALCAAALALLGARAGHAQADPRVVAAVRQAQEGSGDSARATLARLLEATPPGDSLYPEILLATALVSPTAQEMQRHLQRVVVEHALSRWADDALLKLAQLEYASGNLPGTVRQLERIRTDFPGSDVLGLAAFWAARTHFDLNDSRSACRWIGIGLAATPAGAEDLRAQLDAFARRCPGDQLAAGAVSAPPRRPAEGATTAVPVPAGTAPPDTIRLAPPDTARPAAPREEPARPEPARSEPARDEPAAAPADPAPVYRIQVVAAGTQEAANDAAARLQRLGFTSRIVSEGAFLKVRAGAFASREEAGAARRRLVAEFPGAFVVEE
ncbi:MAG TPA: SPOR domain-containing protein [Gemmatimonadales bacterium]